jgi:PBSX family phage portal protein
MAEFNPSESPRGAKIVKAVSFGGVGQAAVVYPSKQLLDDPFGVMYGAALTAPPFSLEQLVLLAESHPSHSAAIDQKVNDIIADGLQFKPDTDADKNEEIEKALTKWWNDLSDEYTPIELLQAVWSDYETMGWGFLEIVRDINGIVQQVYHVPAHTVRAHVDGVRFTQMRMGKQVWFKKWGTEQDYFASNGNMSHTGNLPPDRSANELLVFRRPSRRSSWYGVPSYVSAIGWIALATAARDFNIKIMENNRQPRHLVTITGLEKDVDNIIATIEAQIAAATSGTAFSNILIPIEGNADVKVARLGEVQNELAFAKLIDVADTEILMAHRVPPDRLGFSQRGALSGSVTDQIDAIYKAGVVSRGQTVAEDRLTRFTKVEFTRANANTIAPDRLRYSVDLEELDISDESVDVDNVTKLAEDSLITLNEGRARLKLEKHEPFGNMTLDQWKQKLIQDSFAQGMGSQMNQPAFGNPQQTTYQALNETGQDEQVQKRLDKVAERHVQSMLERIDGHVLDLLTERDPTGELGMRVLG